MKTPILIREMRVWWYCPEIRSSVAKGMVYLMARHIITLPIALLTLPLYLMHVGAGWLSVKALKLAEIICSPGYALNSKRRQLIERSHEVLKPSEIRSRMGRPDPEIVSKEV